MKRGELGLNINTESKPKQKGFVEKLWLVEFPQTFSWKHKVDRKL